MLLTHIVALYDEHVTVTLVDQNDGAPAPWVAGAINIRLPPVRGTGGVRSYKSLEDIPNPKIRHRVSVLKLVPVSDAIEGYGIRASENIYWITTIGENEHEGQ
jgi:hypothetical protein